MTNVVRALWTSLNTKDGDNERHESANYHGDCAREY